MLSYVWNFFSQFSSMQLNRVDLTRLHHGEHCLDEAFLLSRSPEASLSAKRPLSRASRPHRRRRRRLRLQRRRLGVSAIGPFRESAAPSAVT